MGGAASPPLDAPTCRARYCRRGTWALSAGHHQFHRGTVHRPLGPVPWRSVAASTCRDKPAWGVSKATMIRSTSSKNQAPAPTSIAGATSVTEQRIAGVEVWGCSDGQPTEAPSVRK